MRRMFPPLEDQVIQANLAGANAQLVDEKVVDPDRVVLSENAEYVTEGEVQKILGTTEHSYALKRAGTQLRYAHMMETHNDQLLVAGKPEDSSNVNFLDEYYSMHVLDRTPATDELVDIGRYPGLSQRSSVVSVVESDSSGNNPPTPAYDPDIAKLGGYVFMVWTDLTDAFISVQSEESGAIVHEGTIFDAGANNTYAPRIIAVDTKLHFWCVCANGGAYEIHWVEVDPLDPDGYTAGAPGVGDPSYIDSTATGLFDACYFNDGANGPGSVACYKVVGGGNNLHWYTIDDDGTNKRSINNATVPTNQLGVEFLYDRDNNVSRLVTCFENNGTNRYQYIIMDDTLSVVAGPTDFDNNVAGDALQAVTMASNPAQSRQSGDSEFYIFTERYNAAGPWYRVNSYRVRLENPYTVITAAADEGEEDWYHYKLQTRGFTHLERPHVWVTYESLTDLSGNLLYEDSSLLLVAGPTNVAGTNKRLEPVANMFSSNTQHRYAKSATNAASLGQVYAYIGSDSGKFLWSAITRESGGLDEETAPKTWAPNSNAFAIRKNTMTFSGDGNYKLYHRPVSVGKNMLVPGGYVGCFDGRMQTHGFLHAPRIVNLTRPGGAASVPAGYYNYVACYEWVDRNGETHYSGTSAVEELDNSAGASDINISVTPYRPDYDVRDVKILVFRSSVGSASGAAPTDYQLVGVISNFNTATGNCLDKCTDAQRGRAIYTAGGVLEDRMPPPTSCMCVHKKRIWLVSDENRRRLYYTKEKADGFAEQFCDEQYITMPEEINAIVGLDDYLYAFSDDRVYAISGDGVDATGAGAGWYTPRIVTADMGCSDPASVAQTALGIVFQAKDDMWVLNAQGLRRLSGDGSAPLFTMPVIRVIERRGKDEIWILSDGQAPYTYNYRFNRWSYMNGHCQPEHACYYDVITGADGLWFFLDESAGGALIKRGTNYTRYPSAATYTFRVKTPWLRLGNLTGFQRVRWVNLLNTFSGSHSFKVILYRDYTTSGAQTETLTSQTGVYRVKPEVQKVTAIQVTVEDVPDSTGCLKLNAVELVCGFKGAHSRRPDSTS